MLSGYTPNPLLPDSPASKILRQFGSNKTQEFTDKICVKSIYNTPLQMTFFIIPKLEFL